MWRAGLGMEGFEFVWCHEEHLRPFVSLSGVNYNRAHSSTAPMWYVETPVTSLLVTTTRVREGGGGGGRRWRWDEMEVG